MRGIISKNARTWSVDRIICAIVSVPASGETGLDSSSVKGADGLVAAILQKGHLSDDMMGCMYYDLFPEVRLRKMLFFDPKSS